MRRPETMARISHRLARVPLARAFGRQHARINRWSRGRLLGRWLGTPVLVLEVAGRRTGRPRSTPVVFAEVDGAYVVTAANAGSDRTPAWWLNLQAAGRGTVHLRGRTFDVAAREAHGAERVRLWDALVAAYPPAATYPDFTARPLPVVVLSPV